MGRLCYMLSLCPIFSEIRMAVGGMGQLFWNLCFLTILLPQLLSRALLASDGTWKTGQGLIMAEFLELSQGNH